LPNIIDVIALARYSPISEDIRPGLKPRKRKMRLRKRASSPGYDLEQPAGAHSSATRPAVRKRAGDREAPGSRFPASRNWKWYGQQPSPDSAEPDAQPSVVEPVASKARMPTLFCWLRRKTANVALIAGAGDRAAVRFLEYFTVNIRNRNTRAAYGRAAADFLKWCEGQGIDALGRVQPVDVAAYIELLQAKRSTPTVKQHLACIRMLFDWLVIGQVMPTIRRTSSGGRVIP
jgi:hypothetical protein